MPAWTPALSGNAGAHIGLGHSAFCGSRDSLHTTGAAHCHQLRTSSVLRFICSSVLRFIPRFLRASLRNTGGGSFPS
jgi:hypothetical protein